MSDPDTKSGAEASEDPPTPSTSSGPAAIPARDEGPSSAADLEEPLLGGSASTSTNNTGGSAGASGAGSGCCGPDGCAGAMGKVYPPLRTADSRRELLLESFPFLKWGPRYNLRRAAGDAIAGLTVGAVIVPQALAYAKLAGVEPIVGLYSCLMCLLVYPLFGSSRYLSVGPVAVVCVVIGQALEGAKLEDKHRHVFVLSIMSGLLMTFMSVMRFGFVGNILSRPIQHGFMNAVCLTVSIEQLDELFGFHTAHSTYPWQKFGFQMAALPRAQYRTALVGFGSVLYCATNVALMRYFPKQIFLQLGILVLVIVSILATHFGELERPTALNMTTLKAEGRIKLGLPPFKSFSLTQEDLSSMMPAMIAVVVVGFIESYAIAQTLENRALDRDLKMVTVRDEDKRKKDAAAKAGGGEGDDADDDERACCCGSCGGGCRAGCSKQFEDTPDVGLSLLSPNSELMAFGLMNIVRFGGGRGAVVDSSGSGVCEGGAWWESSVQRQRGV